MNGYCKLLMKKKKKLEQYHIQDNYVPLQPLLGLCFVLGFFII